MARMSVSLTLKDKDGHDRKSIIRLYEEVFGEQQLLRTFAEGIRILHIRCVIARCSFPILDGEGVVTAVPLQTLEPEPEGDTICSRNNGAALSSTAFRIRVIKPKGKASERRLHI